MYKCAYCQGEFEEGWSDEEAKQEAEEIFGKPIEEWNDTAVVVCDDCFQIMYPKNHTELVDKIKETL